MFRDPCKKCIVDVVCSQFCEDYCQYDDLREILTYWFGCVLRFCLWCFWGLICYYTTKYIVRGVIIGL